MKKKLLDVSHRISIDFFPFGAVDQSFSYYALFEGCRIYPDLKQGRAEGLEHMCLNASVQDRYSTWSSMKQKSRNLANPGPSITKSELVAEKVMLGISRRYVPSLSELRGTTLTDDIQDILLELYQAISARTVYEAAIELPLDDLFFVGGQLGALIRKAEHIQRVLGYAPAEYQRYSLSFRISEARAFRRYIVDRIKRGA